MVEDIINAYRNFESKLSISRRFGVTTKYVDKILKENRVEKISYAKRFNHNIIEDYFENIDCPEKAYWLGWLITDGCISKKNTVSMCLHSKDRYILEVFQEDLGLENKVHDFNEDYCRLVFCCKKMVEDLEKYGIVKNKTNTVTLPEIREDLKIHLLRGCLDGDGGISYTKRNGKFEYELNFCGNYDTVSKFNEYICDVTGITVKNIVKNNSIYRVRWSSKNEIIRIIETLYVDEKRMLKRKYEFLELLKS